MLCGGKTLSASVALLSAHVSVSFAVENLIREADREFIQTLTNPVASSFFVASSTPRPSSNTTNVSTSIATPQPPSNNSHSSSSNSTQSSLSNSSIPKIIHWMYKTDPSKSGWPNVVWKESHEAWLKYFPEPEYQYRFWSDVNTSQFFAKHCSNEYDKGEFDALSNPIMRADLGRYCILMMLGGIYTDLDYEPRVNFYHEFIPGKISLISSPYPGEIFQNSLMASPVGVQFKSFWKSVLATARRQVDSRLPPNVKALRQKQAKVVVSVPVVECSGPKLLDACYKDKKLCPKDIVHMLGCDTFQLPTHHVNGQGACNTYLTAKNVKQVKGIHWGTWSWVPGFSSAEAKINEETKKLFSSLHPHAQMKWNQHPKSSFLDTRLDGFLGDLSWRDLFINIDIAGHVDKVNRPSEQSR